MDIYRELFFYLYAMLGDAAEQLEAQNYGLALDILREARSHADEQYITFLPEDG